MNPGCGYQLCNLGIETRRFAQSTLQLIDRAGPRLKHAFELRCVLSYFLCIAVSHIDPRTEVIDCALQTTEFMLQGAQRVCRATKVGSQFIRNERERAPMALHIARAFQASVERHDAELVERAGKLLEFARNAARTTLKVM